MTLIGDCYRAFHSTFSRKPSKFGWISEGKLVASGRLMTHAQIAWVIKHWIKSIITIREKPINEMWLEECSGILLLKSSTQGLI
jgi:hypothetical protein